MTLTLQIENFRVLDDGGPVSVTVPKTGLQVGRRDGMDWVLPDASRYISGHHFEVTHDGHRWWLRDLSTNGTFLQGHKHRLDGPHAVADGDRFEVGHYIIVALFDQPDAGAAISPGSLPHHQVDQPVQEYDADDPWALGSPSLTPVDVTPRDDIGRGAGFDSNFIEMPQAPVAENSPAPAARPAPAPVPVAPAKPDESAFLRGFLRGTQLDGDFPEDLDPEMLGAALGEAMRVTATQMMAALKERAAARHFTRAGERTMRGATDNNPLKFLPDTRHALEAMFLRPRAGFMTGTAALDEALDDLRRHQNALFAALQPALIELLHDLDPGRIDADAKGKAAFGANRKARAWDEFVNRWDAKTASENGILDEFIRLFAAAYRKADDRGGID